MAKRRVDNRRHAGPGAQSGVLPALPPDFVQNDGSDWSLGTPSVLIPGWGVHDAWLDLDGQLWFTCNIPNRRTTIGKIDPKSGEVKLLKVPGPNGLAA